LDDYDYEYAAQIASEVEVPIVFANADSGEEFVTVEENVGDRQHLQLWHSTEKLVSKRSFEIKIYGLPHKH
jgi:hypothetical protein